MATFQIKKRDTAPPIEATLTADDVAVDLTGASVRFHMQDSSGTVKVDAAANIDDAAAGEVSYDWTAADTDTTGHFKAEWEVTFTDSTIRTFPNPGYTNVRIGGDLA
jgi:hypothetical protein